jgi:hypothetical protein
MAEPKRGRGRPPKAIEARKRNNVTIRVRDALKQQLETQAEANQRSLSEETEARLERSFDRQGLLAALELAFGRQMAGVLIALGSIMTLYGSTTVRRKSIRDKNHPAGTWLSDSDAYGLAMAAAVDFLDRARPPIQSPDPKCVEEHELKGPEFIAGEMARAIRQTSETEWGFWVYGPEKIEAIRSLLGPMIERLRDDGPAMMPVSTKSEAINE